MKKVLLGLIINGKAGGIDKYLLNFYDSVKGDGLQIDFLSNQIDPELQEQLAEEGVGLYCVSSLKNPRLQYRQTVDLIRRNGYDIVYMNISTALAFPVLQAAHDCGVKKIIVHSHTSGVDEERLVPRLIKTGLHYLLRSRLASYATDYLACSDKAAQWLFPQKVLESGKLQCVYNGVDTSLFAPNPQLREYYRQELGLTGHFTVGTVGNLCYQKNQLFLLKAFEKLLRMEPNARLVIIGDGVRMPRIRKFVEKRGLQEQVLLLGRVDASLGYMNAFDVFALPSNFEGLGIVLVEAQCTGVPCVASTAVPPSAAISNVCRFVPLSAQAWADALLRWKHHGKEEIVYNGTEKFSLRDQKQELKAILTTPGEGN